MKKVNVFENNNLVGELCLLEKETYSFSYSKKWLDSPDSFSIDPKLPLNNEIYYNNNLWGAFMDISPDRWGRLIQSRNANRFLNDSEYMLGVSDYFRIGALRLNVNDEFVTSTKDIPKLIHINALQDSTLRLESDTYTKQDIQMLLSPSSSIGGARPKACINDNDKLYIAKFPSKNDISSVILWECVMLEISRLAKINTANFKLIKSNNKPIILVERFDRLNNSRIPFMSAMTLMESSEKDESSKNSYVKIAQKLNTNDKKELFRRMIFNGLFGNTDDHLRNHALLYKQKQWSLSPAYDINPTPLVYEKQAHALCFKDGISLPNLDLFKNIAKEFEVNEIEFKAILSDCINAGKKYKEIALKYGIKTNEIKLYEQNFLHNDIVNAQKMLEKIKNINSQEEQTTETTDKIIRRKR